MVLSSADMFYKSVCLLLCFQKNLSGISVECQAVWIDIILVGPDFGPNCLQRLSADDTNKQRVYGEFKQIRVLTRNAESGIYIKLKKHQILACLRYFGDKLCQQSKQSSG